jgi:hypothetical protein
MRPAPPFLSPAWIAGTTINLSASALTRLPRLPRWLDGVIEQACLRWDWREDPLF